MAVSCVRIVRNYVSRVGLNVKGLLQVPIVNSSTSAPTGNKILEEHLKKADDLADKYAKHVDEAVARWAKSDEVYFGKERDFQNFPTMKYTDKHPKIRFGFLPDSWFQSLYPKTGVTGPYLFIFGSTTFLISKEIWVIDPHFLEFGVLGIIMTVLIKRYGQSVGKFLDTDLEQMEKIKYYEPLKKLHNNIDMTIKTADEEKARASAVSSLVKAKEENVALQLEVSYRDRLQQAYKAVHRRLDYHVEREDTRRRFLQQHMVDWVVNNVVSGFTPNQEKETLTRCISDLRKLGISQKTAAAATA